MMAFQSFMEQFKMLGGPGTGPKMTPKGATSKGDSTVLSNLGPKLSERQ